MEIEERIAAVEANIATVRANALVHGVNIESLHSSVAELHASMAELQIASARENESLKQDLRQLYSTSVQQGESIRTLAASIAALARITEVHGSRITTLESGGAIGR